MSPVFAARRRAEEFDALVQRERAPERLSAEETRYGELLQVASALRTVPAPEPRPTFSASLRERLMTAAATELAGSEAPSLEDRLTVPARRGGRERRIAIAVGAFAVVGATTSMAVASQSALPGDALYPVKRAIEDARAGVSVGDQQKGATLLGNAAGRLREVEQLAREDRERQDTEAIRDTLRDFGEQAGEASTLLLSEFTRDGDQASADALQSFVADSLTSLEVLSDLIADDARDELVGAGNVLLGIELELQQVCPDCPQSLTQMPQWLVSQAATSTGVSVPPRDDTSAPDSEAGSEGPDGSNVRPPRPQSSAQPALPTDIPSLPGASPSATPAPGGGTGDVPGKDPSKGPVGNLIEDLTGGTENNPVPIVPELLAGVGDLLDAVTAPLLGGLGEDRTK